MIAEQFDLVSRSAQVDDEVFLEQLFYQCLPPELAPLGLPAAALQQMLALQYRGRNMTYSARYPEADDRVLWVDGARAGRLTLQRSAHVLRVVDLAVAPEFRGRGVATRALQNVLAEAAASEREVQLEVRATNPAARLYQRLGFVVTEGDGFNARMTWQGRKAIGLAADGGEAPAAEVAAAPQDGTSAYFRNLLGMAFAANGGPIRTEIVLKRVEVLVQPKDYKSGDSFVLRFDGPLEPILPSGCVEVHPPQGGPMTIFLSPLGPERGFMRYEAIFNRAQA